MAAKGTYIVLEGAQGVGKTAIATLVVAELERLGIPAKSMQEPDSHADMTTQEIRRLTQDPKYPMNSRTEALLYNAARSQSLETVRTARDDGYVCIVDRSYLTTLAVQFYGRGDITDYQRLNDIITFAVGDMWPDLTIVLDAPVELLEKRAKKRGEKERFDKLDAEMLERVRAGYLWEARQRNMPIVYATGTIEEVFQDVWRHIAVAIGLESGVASQPTAVADLLAKSPAASILKEKQPVQSNTTEYFVPPALPDDLQCDYCDDIDKLLRDRRELVRKLSTHLAAGKPSTKATTVVDEAERILRPLLPVACAPEMLRERLIHNENLELDEKMVAKLPKSFSSSSETVRLVEASPRNELDLLPAMLYETLDLPLNELKQAIDALSYEVKSTIFKQYLGKYPTGKALQQASYTFDMLTDASVLEQLSEELVSEVQLQSLTPRYGYDIPKVVEEADLSDEYDAIFDQSLQLQSTLQARGFTAESQNACLLGHRQRWLLRLDASDFKAIEHTEMHRLLLDLLNDKHALLRDVIASRRTKYGKK